MARIIENTLQQLSGATATVLTPILALRQRRHAPGLLLVLLLGLCAAAPGGADPGDDGFESFDDQPLEEPLGNPDWFKLSFLDIGDDLQEAIADGKYPVSRPLFFYVKKAHVDVIPGLRGYLREFTSERAWGDEGYLAERGLIPMPGSERREVALAVRDLVTISLARE